MSGISFGGMASGLPPNIVEQLMDAERIPIKNMEAKKTKEDNKLKLVTELETKLNAIRESTGDLASAKGFRDVKLDSGDPTIVSGAVDSAAGVTGSWNIEVVELAQKSAAITNGFPDKDETRIGTGYFRFETKDGPKEVYIGRDNSTLEGAANAINTSGLEVRATVINDRENPDRPYKLMISGSEIGGDNQLEFPTLYFLDGDEDLFFDKSNQAKNGKVKVDGFEFQISDNKVRDVIPGVTLDLRQAAPGRQVNIAVKEDLEVVTERVKKFVDAVNGVLGFIQAQNKLDGNTDTSSTLGGDGLLRSVESRLRRLIQNPQMGVASTITRLNQVGIEFNRSGTVNFSQDKFNATLLKDPSSVQRFLNGDGFATGFIPSLKREIGSVLDGAFGPVSNRKRSLQSKIKRIDEQIANRERTLAMKEKNLRTKFANLETNMSRLKSQMAQVGTMGGVGGLI